VAAVTLKALTLYPAIDLKGGRCVRLLRGDLNVATVFNEDPAAQAAAFFQDGFDRLHIVDLDGAVEGRSANAEAVKVIVAATRARWQIGGGVRDRAALERWIDAGAARVILGTAAVRNPEFVAEAAAAFPGRVVVGVDALNGEARTDGWLGGSGADAVDVARRFEDCGVAAIIYTDIHRDGALAGPNVEATAALAEAISIPVIASGGVSAIGDIEALARAHANIEGVILGRALYEGRFTAAAARKAALRAD
jgi:phosphoribosylformimino-5-aminoimidazole carboxamide ribotide isomerase